MANLTAVPMLKVSQSADVFYVQFFHVIWDVKSQISDRSRKRDLPANNSTTTTTNYYYYHAPAGAAGERPSPRSTLCADSYFGIRSASELPQ